MKALALNRIALFLSFVGLYIAGVLSVAKFLSASVPCGASHGCETVANHWTAHALGIPTAYLGFLAYAAFAALSYVRLINPKLGRKTLVIGYALSAIGTGGSLVLTYVSIAVIGATCMWCLASAFTMILLLVVHAAEMQADRPVEPEPTILNGIMLAALCLALVIALGIQGSIMRNVAMAPPLNMDFKNPPELYVPAGAHVYGNPDAPVTLVEFGDLLCPACQGEYGKIKDFIGTHPGVIRYVYREFPMIYLHGHEQSAPASIAAEIAGEQSEAKFWDFVNEMYSVQRSDLPDTNPILDVAASLGMDRKKTLERIRDPEDKAFKRMMKDLNDGMKIGVTGTPTFFILAKDVKGIRAANMYTLIDDLNRPEYKKFYKGG